MARRALLLLDGLDEGGVARDASSDTLPRCSRRRATCCLPPRGRRASTKALQRLHSAEPLAPQRRATAAGRRAALGPEACEGADAVCAWRGAGGQGHGPAHHGQPAHALDGRVDLRARGVALRCPRRWSTCSEVATKAMLERAGAKDDAALPRALAALFFEAHITRIASSRPSTSRPRQSDSAPTTRADSS